MSAAILHVQADCKWSDMPVRDSMDSMPSSDFSFDAQPQTMHRRSSILSRSSEPRLDEVSLHSNSNSQTDEQGREDTVQRKSAENARGAQDHAMPVRRSISVEFSGSLAAFAASNSRGAALRALKDSKLTKSTHRA